MRISTSAIYDANVSMLNQQQAKLLHTQQQLASGRRMLTASDDPIASARALEVSQADAMNTQYDTNRKSAISSSTFAEGILQSVTNLLQDVRTSTIDAGGALGSLTNRQSIAVDMQHRLEELQGLANSTDGLGNYLFSGFQGRTLPFTNVAGAFQYNGDDGQRMIQVSSSRQLAGSDSGADIFMRIKNGNGKFTLDASPDNSGTGIVSQGVVTNPAWLTGHEYKLSFQINTVNGIPLTTYDVIDATSEQVLSKCNPFVSGQVINFDGMQFDISGEPAEGDEFIIKPSENESLFKTISDLITALKSENSVGGDAAKAQYTNSINRALNNIDRGLQNVSTIRTSLGSRLRELDALQVTGEDLGLQYKTKLSELQDVDFNKAVSDLNQQQTSLTAAQKSFKQVSDLSLFNYL